MSGSRWVITPSWLSGSLRLLFYSPSVYPGEGNGNPLHFLAWKIPWTEEPGRLQSMELQRVGHDWVTSHSVYPCHLFLISSASAGSIPLLFFIGLIFSWNVPLVSNFLEEISSLSQSTVFLYFFALLTYEGLLISPWNSLQLCIQMGISFLFSFAFCFSSFLSYL